MTMPPAEGVRVGWDSVSWPVRPGIEQICGSAVVRAQTQPRGFSPGLAVRVECRRTRTMFVDWPHACIGAAFVDIVFLAPSVTMQGGPRPEIQQCCYIVRVTYSEPGAFTGLGTQLRHVLDLMEADVAGVLADLGLPGYRPRFSPVVLALVARGPMPIRELARAISVTHSAASQTVAEMNKRGYVCLVPGRDARQRVVHLTERTRQALPVIQAEWDATRSAAEQLDSELPFPLSGLVPAIASALERKPFRQRIAEAAWSAAHPEVTAALASQDQLASQG